MSVCYDPTAAVFEAFSDAGVWLGAFDTAGEAEAAVIADRPDTLRAAGYTEAQIAREVAYIAFVARDLGG
jgi:hypothetical protein